MFSHPAEADKGGNGPWATLVCISYLCVIRCLILVKAQEPLGGTFKHKSFPSQPDSFTESPMARFLKVNRHYLPKPLSNF